MPEYPNCNLCDPDAEPYSYPTPEVAYAAAPSIVREISWVADYAARRAFDEPTSREFWLRKAALLDRIALDEMETYAPEVAARAVTAAQETAHRLMQVDGAHFTTSAPGPSRGAPEPSYRPYVRQEYQAWSDSTP